MSKQIEEGLSVIYPITIHDFCRGVSKPDLINNIPRAIGKVEYVLQCGLHFAWTIGFTEKAKYLLSKTLDDYFAFTSSL